MCKCKKKTTQNRKRQRMKDMKKNKNVKSHYTYKKKTEKENNISIEQHMLKSLPYRQRLSPMFFVFFFSFSIVHCKHMNSEIQIDIKYVHETQFVVVRLTYNTTQNKKKHILIRILVKII